MTRLIHVESYYADPVEWLGQSSLLGIGGAGPAPRIEIVDPATSIHATAGLGDGTLDMADFDTVSIKGATRTIAIDGSDRQIDAATIDRLAAHPGEGGQAALDESAFWGNRITIESFGLGSATWAAAAKVTGSGFALYDLGRASETLTPAFELDDTRLGRIADFETVQVGDRTFLLAASVDAGGVSAIEIADNGKPRITDAMGKDAQLPVDTPTAIATVATEDGAFVLLASAGTGSITVLSLSATGALDFVDQVIDTRTTRFGAVSALDTITVNGQVLVAAAGNDGGVTLMQLLPDGRLIHRDTLIDSLDSALWNISALRFVATDDRIDLFAMATGENGMARIQIEADKLGAVTTGADGTDKSDLVLTGPAGGDLSGGAGDDLIVDADGQTTLIGGAGADVFVFRSDGEQDVILDFDRSQDRIDLTGFLGHYSSDEIKIVATHYGGIVLLEEERIIVRSADGAPLPPDVLEAALQFDLNRVEMPDSLAWLTFTGTAMPDALTGTTGDETFSGLEGGDWITPGGGLDTVDGGPGSDMVSFVNLPQGVAIDLAAGTATSGTSLTKIDNIENVTGTIYGDYILGDGGTNRLRGLGDYDWFVGSGGSDTYDGGNGRDMISYVFADSAVTVDLGAGKGLAGLALGDNYTSIERATGSTHADLFYGGAGEEDFRGLGGYDWFVGSGGGKDRYDGGSGLDTVSYALSTAGVTASLILGRGSSGDAARDLYTSIENLTGTSFDDVLTGDNGRNVLRGMWGEDVLIGNGGVDRLSGGASDDFLNGGSGWDYAFFDGNRADFTVVPAGSGWLVTDTVGRGGTDSVFNIETLIFDDGQLFL